MSDQERQDYDDPEIPLIDYPGSVALAGLIWFGLGLVIVVSLVGVVLFFLIEDRLGFLFILFYNGCAPLTFAFLFGHGCWLIVWGRRYWLGIAEETFVIVNSSVLAAIFYGIILFMGIVLASEIARGFPTEILLGLVALLGCLTVLFVVAAILGVNGRTRYEQWQLNQAKQKATRPSNPNPQAP